MSNIFKVILLILLFTSNSKAQKSFTIDRIVGSVNDHAITAFELNSRLKLQKAFMALSDSNVTSLNKEEVLKEMAMEIAITEEANRLSIITTETQVDAYIDRIIASQGKDQFQLSSELSNKNIPFDAYKDRVRFEITKAQVIRQALDSTIVDEIKKESSSEKKPKALNYSDNDVELEELFIPKNDCLEIDCNKFTKYIFASFSQASTLRTKQSNKYYRYISHINTNDIKEILAKEINSLPEGARTGVINGNNGIYIIHIVSRGKNLENKINQYKSRSQESEQYQKKLDKYLNENLLKRYSINYFL